MRFNPECGLLALAARFLALTGTGLFCMTVHSTMAAPPAEAMLQQCRSKPSLVEQRDCLPDAIRQSEIELAAAEKEARADLIRLENSSAGSHAVRPVLAFDRAARAFRAFRDAESGRVRASYGSGNGGDLAANVTFVEMNIARARLLTGEVEKR